MGVKWLHSAGVAVFLLSVARVLTYVFACAIAGIDPVVRDNTYVAWMTIRTVCSFAGFAGIIAAIQLSRQEDGGGKLIIDHLVLPSEFTGRRFRVNLILYMAVMFLYSIDTITYVFYIWDPQVHSQMVGKVTEALYLFFQLTSAFGAFLFVHFAASEQSATVHEELSSKFRQLTDLAASPSVAPSLDSSASFDSDAGAASSVAWRVRCIKLFLFFCALSQFGEFFEFFMWPLWQNDEFKHYYTHSQDRFGFLGIVRPVIVASIFLCMEFLIDIMLGHSSSHQPRPILPTDADQRDLPSADPLPDPYQSTPNSFPPTPSSAIDDPANTEPLLIVPQIPSPFAHPTRPASVERFMHGSLAPISALGLVSILLPISVMSSHGGSVQGQAANIIFLVVNIAGVFSALFMFFFLTRATISQKFTRNAEYTWPAILLKGIISSTWALVTVAYAFLLLSTDTFNEITSDLVKVSVSLQTVTVLVLAVVRTLLTVCSPEMSSHVRTSRAAVALRVAHHLLAAYVAMVIAHDIGIEHLLTFGHEDDLDGKYSNYSGVSSESAAHEGLNPYGEPYEKFLLVALPGVLELEIGLLFFLIQSPDDIYHATHKSESSKSRGQVLDGKAEGFI